MPLIQKRLKSHGNMRWVVTTPPTTEPITVSEVKEYARIDYSAEDTLISTLIQGVREATENWLGRALITQTVEAYMDYVAYDEIVFPKPPFITLNSFQVRQFNGTTEDVSADIYYLTDFLNPCRLIIHESTLPTTDREKGGYVLNFDAGYGDAADVPAGIRLGMLEWVLSSWENRIVDREPNSSAKTYLSKFKQARAIL